MPIPDESQTEIDPSRPALLTGALAIGVFASGLLVPLLPAMSSAGDAAG